jgi:hypothetical protein
MPSPSSNFSRRILASGKKKKKVAEMSKTSEHDTTAVILFRLFVSLICIWFY